MVVCKKNLFAFVILCFLGMKNDLYAQESRVHEHTQGNIEMLPGGGNGYYGSLRHSMNSHVPSCNEPCVKLGVSCCIAIGLLAMITTHSLLDATQATSVINYSADKVYLEYVNGCYVQDSYGNKKTKICRQLLFKNEGTVIQSSKKLKSLCVTDFDRTRKTCAVPQSLQNCNFFQISRVNQSYAIDDSCSKNRLKEKSSSQILLEQFDLESQMREKQYALQAHDVTRYLRGIE